MKKENINEKQKLKNETFEMKEELNQVGSAECGKKKAKEKGKKR